MPDGLIIIDKPAGLTSHDVVARLRRILKTKKIGHTGTLDPFATGVLVMLVGKATRLARFLHSDEKEYEAVLRFGFETDTGDVTGERRDDPDGNSSDKLQFVGPETITQALHEFRGEVEQVPPMYSAKKIDGKRLYKLAREGVEVERQPVKVLITELELTGEVGAGTGTKHFGLRVACSAGTYIRTLAEDIGRKIGIGCHLAELRRIRAGRFRIDQAITLEGLERSISDAELPPILPLAEAVSHLVSYALSASDLERVARGMPILPGSVVREIREPIAMLTAEGALAAVGEYDETEKVIRPKLVMV